MLLLTPFAAAFFNVLADIFLFALISSDCPDCGFENLGLLLFGGILTAVAVAVIFTWLRMRRKDAKTESSSFISINPPK